MLFDSQTGTFSLEGLFLLLLFIPAMLISLSLHEVAHGYAAYKCGDNTAKAFGRLNLNPLAHLDPIGTILLLFIGFGWAKPVPINPRNFRKPRRDMFIVSIAGVVVNLLLGLLGVLLFYGFVKLNFLPDNILRATLLFCQYFAILNIGLAVFNLIPLPPLDGSKVLSTILPPVAAAKYLRIEYYARYIFMGLIILSWLPYPLSLLNDYLWMPLEYARDGILELYSKIAMLIFNL
jgi:Zn-dependent protease